MEIDELIRQTELIIREGYGEYINVKGTRIRYRVRGSGQPPVLLLHGLGGFLEMWWLNVESLGVKNTVYAIDLPGHGLSEPAKNCYEPDCATEYVIAIMEALAMERVFLVGHSMGGLISVNVCTAFPEKVAKLVLVDAAGLTEYVPLRFRMLALPLLGPLLLDIAERQFYKTGIRNLFYKKELSDQIIGLFMRNASRIWPKNEILDLSRKHFGIRGIRHGSLILDKLPRIACPTMFVHGAQDRIFPLEHVKGAFSRVSDARIEVIDKAGHMPQIEQPDVFNEIISEFF